MTQTLELCVPTKRGQPPRILRVDPAGLNEVQLRVLREYLPQERKTGRALLKGLASPQRSPQYCPADEHGEIQAVRFAFEVPEQATDADAPALLERWHQALQAASARRARRGKANAGRSVVQAQPAAVPGGEERVPAAAAAVVADTLDEALVKLPLLREFAVERIQGPGTLRLALQDQGLAEPRICCALIHIETFGRSGIEQREVGLDLAQAFGPRWTAKESEAQDLQHCLEQARVRLSQVWEQFNAALAEQADVPARRGTGRARARAGQPLGLPQLLEIARQIRIDQHGAEHTVRTLRDSLQEQPAWAAQAVQAMERQVEKGNLRRQPETVAEYRDLFSSWCESLAGIDASGQMSLWTKEAHRRQQRALQAQVHRARAWHGAAHADAAQALAAVALLVVGA